MSFLGGGSSMMGGYGGGYGGMGMGMGGYGNNMMSRQGMDPNQAQQQNNPN